jgi:hypothetical protein
VNLDPAPRSFEPIRRTTIGEKDRESRSIQRGAKIPCCSQDTLVYFILGFSACVEPAPGDRQRMVASFSTISSHRYAPQLRQGARGDLEGSRATRLRPIVFNQFAARLGKEHFLPVVLQLKRLAALNPTFPVQRMRFFLRRFAVGLRLRHPRFYARNSGEGLLHAPHLRRSKDGKVYDFWLKVRPFPGRFAPQ